MKKKRKCTGYIVIGVVFTGIIAGMLIPYFYKFREWSDNPADWGAFGAYMGALAGLLAFAGVIYSLYYTNAKARAQNEKNTFFRLLELHQRSMETLVYRNIRIQRKSSMMEAFVDYKEELDSDLQEVIVFWDSCKFKSYAAWIEKIDGIRYNGLLALLAGTYISNERQKGKYVTRQRKKQINSLTEDVEFMEQVKRSSDTLFKEMRGQLNKFIEFKYIMSYYDDLLSLDKRCFKELANSIWVEKEMDESERFSILRFVAECFHRKYEHVLSYHFNNLCNITFQIDAMETDHDFFMDSWISNITSIEGVILFFWMLSGKVNKEVLVIAKRNNLFRNMNLGEFCAYKWDYTNKKSARVTNDYLQMQIDEMESIPFFKSRGPFDKSIMCD